MTTHPITRPVSAIQRRQRREHALASRPAGDRSAIHHFRCMRCERLMWTRGIATECYLCIDGAVRAWGLGPIRGEVSGA